MILGMVGPWQILLILILGVFGLILPLIALIDILRNDFKGNNDKIIWVLVVLFFNIIGSMLYFAMGRKQRV
ncbi:PLDc N-terminal domain-containing protein [Leeuwenhoekiella parthenopeia]|uniref:PLDc N-terminal domain-containing protein n=1 Tax=Leeuwenhoekiella parthenopeia TaxID=2890320 RepID=A0ABS8GUL3_9FLAO|nr:PLDc N-terminal domain-containing protein [Leeuwenhoekiella parthenopeia]MCC4212902.1 PLDc N-terminal domain-containing protein [Leeuwenhoekiella parthenopeia]